MPTKVIFAQECAEEFGDFFTDLAVKSDYLLFVQEAIDKLSVLLKYPKFLKVVDFQPNSSNRIFQLPADFLDIKHVEKRLVTGALIGSSSYLVPATRRHLLQLGINYHESTQIFQTPETLFDGMVYYWLGDKDETTGQLDIGIWDSPASIWGSGTTVLKLYVHYFSATSSFGETDELPFTRGVLDILKLKIRALSHEHENNTEEAELFNTQFAEQLLVLGTRLSSPHGNSKLRMLQVEAS